MTDLRKEWTCSACGVRCYKMTGEPFPRPEGWVGDRCLSCARFGESPEEMARRELLDGKSPGRVCAKGVSKKWMKDLQKELIEAGELDPSALDSKKKAAAAADEEEKLRVVKELLKADPTKTDGEVQREAGASQGYGKRAREELGLKSAQLEARDRRDEEIAAAYRADPAPTRDELAARFGVSTSVITAACKRLGLGLPDGRAGRRIKQR